MPTAVYPPSSAPAARHDASPHHVEGADPRASHPFPTGSDDSPLPGQAISVRGLSRVFADGSGLHPADLEVRAGEFVSVLGPSGCGKSTLLRCVAGLQTPDTGTIRFGEMTVFDADQGLHIPTRKRGLGMVFQDLALWPHLNAQENVAFPLRVARTPKQEVAERVAHALSLVGLTSFADKMPHQLSGGQQQRVAIARAIVARPGVLLMDEPFSALDAALRLQLRDELRELTTSLGLTTLYVTHDQAEAMAMSDRIAVLDRGIVRQVSTPEMLYERPESRFVAEFIGSCNWVPGEVGQVGVRPEHVQVLPAATETTRAESSPAQTGDSFQAFGTIRSCAYTGGEYALTCEIDDSNELWMLEHTQRLTPGTRITVSVASEHLMHVS